MDHVDHPRRRPVPAQRGGAPAGLHRLAALAPDVALEHVVVVGDAQRRPVAHRLAERPAELVVLAQVVQDRRPGRVADQPIAAMVLVELVAGEEDQVGIERQNVLRDRRVRERVVVLAGEGTEPERPARGIHPDRPEPLRRRLAAVRVPFAVHEPERRRLPFVPPRQPERRRPRVRVELGEAAGSPFAVVLREQLDAPVVAPSQRRHERRHLDHEPFVAPGVAHRVHRPQDGPEAALLFHGEGIPVRRPLAEPVAGPLTLRDLPVEVADDRDVALDVRGGHGVGDGAQLGSGGGPNFKAELTLAVFRSPLEKHLDPFRCDRVAVAYLRVRSTQHQPPADQPGIDPNAARKTVAAMVVDQVADTDPKPYASVPLPGLHPPATDRHPKPPLLARQSMRDQVHVPVAARGLHLRRPVHNPPVLHGIGPERLPKPHPVMGPVPPVDLGALAATTRFLLRCPGPPNPLRQRNDRRQQSKQTSPGQAALRQRPRFLRALRDAHHLSIALVQRFERPGGQRAAGDRRNASPISCSNMNCASRVRRSEACGHLEGPGAGLGPRRQGIRWHDTDHTG